MSTLLIDSTSKVSPACSTSGAAWRRFASATSVACSREVPSGTMPASAFSFLVPSWAARAIAWWMLRMNSSSRPGRQSKPRSPPAQFPGAGSNRTRSSSCSSRMDSRRSASSSWGKSISTFWNPCRAAAANRSYGSSSVHSMVRFAAKVGKCVLLVVLVRDGGRLVADLQTSCLLHEPHQAGHVVGGHAEAARLGEELLGKRAPLAPHMGPFGLGLNEPQVFQDQADRRRPAEVAGDEARDISEQHLRSAE